MSEVSIKVTGLKEFNKNLRKISPEAPKQLRIAGNNAAAVVVRVAKSRIPTGPPRRGHVSSSIRVASTRTAVRVSGGGKRFPYYGWLEFGGAVGIRGSVKRSRRKEGRYLWPAFMEHRQQVEDELKKGLVEVAQSAGFQVS